MNPDDDIEFLRDALADADGQARITQAQLDDLDDTAQQSVRVAAEEALASAQRAVARVRGRLIAAETTQAGSEPPAEAAPVPGERVPAFENVADFVDAYLLEHWRRESLVWCATWWRHSEALDRLRALWLAWEASRYEGPMAMTAWWRDYADPTMAVLTSNSGPFAHCDHTTGSHELLKRVRVHSPPAELLDS